MSRRMQLLALLAPAILVVLILSWLDNPVEKKAIAELDDRLRILRSESGVSEIPSICAEYPVLAHKYEGVTSHTVQGALTNYRLECEGSAAFHFFDQYRQQIEAKEPPVCNLSARLFAAMPPESQRQQWGRIGKIIRACCNPPHKDAFAPYLPEACANLMAHAPDLGNLQE